MVHSALLRYFELFQLLYEVLFWLIWNNKSVMNTLPWSRFYKVSQARHRSLLETECELLAVVYRIRILESNPAGYLDWISFPFQPDPDYPRNKMRPSKNSLWNNSCMRKNYDVSKSYYWKAKPLLPGLADVFCTNTGLFINSDKNLIEKVRGELAVISEHCAFKHCLSISLPLAIVTVTEVKTSSERLIFVH